MHLNYSIYLWERKKQLLEHLPPPFLKQRYGNRQTLPNPTARTNIQKIRLHLYQKFVFCKPKATKVKKNSTGFVHCLRYIAKKMSYSKISIWKSVDGLLLVEPHHLHPFLWLNVFLMIEEKGFRWCCILFMYE